MKVAQVLQQQASSRIGTIDGGIFPPSYFNTLTSQLLTYIFFIGLFLVFIGEYFFTSVFPLTNLASLSRMMKENQIVTMIVLFGCNMLASKLISTGAFEVYFNEQLVFSKIETGIVPEPAYLLELLKHFDS